MRNKNMLILLLCLALFLGVGCSTKEKVDLREKEIVQLVANKKFNEATTRTKELYKGEEMEEMLAWVNKYIKQESEWKQTTQDVPSTTKLEIQSGHTHNSKDNYAVVKGKVKNVSNNEISYFEVIVDLLDGEGNIIHSEYTNDGLKLKPNAMREFEIMFKDSFEYKNYQLSIGKVK